MTEKISPEAVRWGEKLKIEKLIFGGQGLGRVNNRVVMAWNALAGEEVEVEITKHKRGYLEGIARSIIKASPGRIEPKEDHFLSCSPWQILSWEQENVWKKKIAEEVFRKLDLPEFEIVVPEEIYYYRNKMDYSFALDKEGKASLGFFSRGGEGKVPIQGCKLALPEINQVGRAVVAWLNRNKVPAEILKSLCLRGDGAGEVIAGLFLREPFDFNAYPELTGALKGFSVHFGEDLLASFGQDFLEVGLRGLKLQYGLFSFFQIYPALFENVLGDIARFLDPKSKVVDYYAGVGAIGLSLAKHCREVLLIESNKEAIAYAQQNISNNQMSNCRAEFSLAEQALDEIDPDSVIIFDPPRPGLNNKIIKRLLEQKPKRIIYLSCNLSTQARDLKKLLEEYKIKFLRLYNFFPRTPHIESLCVLEKTLDKCFK